MFRKRLIKILKVCRAIVGFLLLVSIVAINDYCIFVIGRKTFHTELLEGMKGGGEELIIIYADDIPTGCLWHPLRNLEWNNHE